MTKSLSKEQARRIALAAQGFAAPRPPKATKRHISAAINRMGLLQIDSVNVLVRSEELPVFARIGPHPRKIVREMDRKGELFEYWVHEASLLPTKDEPLYRWKKQKALRGDDPTVWGGVRNFHRTKPKVVEGVFEEIAARGPLGASQLSTAGGKNRDGWGWHWDEAKLAVENLFWTGRIAASNRNTSFERNYALPENCFPAAVLDQTAPTEREARKELLRRAARAHGIGTAKCLADYHRQKMADARPLLNELEADGELVLVNVKGWADGLYLDPGAAQPRRVNARALLSPFDPLVWERSRTENLFDFRYRIEIYVPKDKRQYGYYVLPFLLGTQLVARVDLKADRAVSTLLVQSAWGEPGINEHEVAAALAEELALQAAWLELDQVIVHAHGDLSSQLRKAVEKQ
jgi:uncharacterized protein